MTFHSSLSIFVPRNLGFCTISRLHCAFSESGNCMPISRLCSTSAQFQDRTISVACTTEPRSLFELPLCIKVRNVCKELSSCSSVITINDRHALKLFTPETSEKFANSEKLPSPRVLVPVQKDPRPVGYPVQGFTNSESSHLSSISQLRLSHPIRPLRE